jgi:hypothetical protein
MQQGGIITCTTANVTIKVILYLLFGGLWTFF